jgi:hypothetical protein
MSSDTVTSESSEPPLLSVPEGERESLLVERPNGLAPEDEAARASEDEATGEANAMDFSMIGLRDAVLGEA